MSNETKISIISLLVGLFIGASTIYATFTTNDAMLNEKIDNTMVRTSQLEGASSKHRIDINTVKVTLAETVTEMKNTNKSYDLLQSSLKDVSNTMKDVSTALVRLEERQKSSGRVIQSLTNKIESLHNERKRYVYSDNSTILN